MDKPTSVKILKFHPEKCKGCLECEKACSQVHFKTKEIRDLKDVFNSDFTDFNEMLDVWFEHRDNTMNYVHPTQKPVRRAERASA